MNIYFLWGGEGQGGRGGGGAGATSPKFDLFFSIYLLMKQG